MAKVLFRRSNPGGTTVSSCVKHTLFSFNFLFWLLSLLVIGVGIWSYQEEYGGDEGHQPEFRSAVDVLLSVSMVLMIAGSFLFLITFSGCLGALRENLCLLRIYSCLMTVVFLCGLALSVLGFVFPDKFSLLIKDALSTDPIVKYRDNLNLQNFIDSLQQEFRCCGISDRGYLDWNENIYFACNDSSSSNSPKTSSRPSEACGVPYSCCINPRNLDGGLINFACGHHVQEKESAAKVGEKIYTAGCVQAIVEFASLNLHIVAGVSLTFAVLQMLAIYLSLALLKQIQAQRERWL